MERAKLMNMMRESISNVLETMFFQPVQIHEDQVSLKGWFSQSVSLWGATLDFDGPLSGSSYLILSDRVANEITANFLGLEEEEIDQNQKEDTVKEALNMIGGKMLSFLEEEGVFKLGIPKLMDKGALNAEGLGERIENAIFIATADGHLAAGVTAESLR